MTGREVLERRVRVVRKSAILGIGLYLVPTFLTCFFPWSAFLALGGILLCIVTVALAFRSLRCPDCGRSLENLLVLRQGRRFLELPAGLCVCPHCGCDFNAQRDHRGLPEILSACMRDGRCLGVVDMPTDGETRRYEIDLRANAREAFERVLRLHPFGRSTSGGYRFFFVSDARDAGSCAGAVSMTIRVERGGESQDVRTPAPESLTGLLEWICSGGVHGQIAGFRLREADAPAPDAGRAAQPS